MDLFIDSSRNSFLAELLANFLNLTNTRRVNVIRLSKSSLTLLQNGGINLGGSLPSLIDTTPKTLTSVWDISNSLAYAAFAENIVIGADEDTKNKVKNYIQLCETKGVDELIETLDEELLTKSFLVGYNITLADLICFVYVSDKLSAMTEVERLEYVNLSRWFDHVQNLGGINEFLRSTGRGLVTFLRPELQDGGKKKKDKKKKQRSLNSRQRYKMQSIRICLYLWMYVQQFVAESSNVVCLDLNI
eukprot:TRINITY_DN1730_c0_g1_i6.p1 TRINITY_DN1730_c0_g1~~TRINITY_DN1730_c0_g1_i6.p1  ORF type:complete len:246 (+),score=50.54 TRINITY_DN1730_c0_g1_i6:91-828(+)